MFVLILIIIALLLIKKTNWFKGFVGEQKVRMLLYTLPANDYVKLHGVILPSGLASTEIDHLIFSQYGVFVIETKNKSGWIYGEKYDKEWTQTFPGGAKFKFQNPLHQNYKHTETLIELLGIDKDHAHSIVTFSSKAEFKTRVPNNVLTYKQLPNYIKSFHHKVFTKEEVQIYTYIIEKKRHRGVFAKLQHIWSLHY